MLLVDVGGVLLTNGWDRFLRAKIAEQFKLELDEMNQRHEIPFDLFERGRLSFDDYLKKIIFYKNRPFSIEDLKNVIFDAVRPYPEMIDLIKEIKNSGLKVGLITNEGRELAEDRFKRFSFSFVDYFVASAFVGFRKPDPLIYKLAIDLAQVPPQEILYIDDRANLIEMGEKMGLHVLHHTDFNKTREAIHREIGALGRSA